MQHRQFLRSAGLALVIALCQVSSGIAEDKDLEWSYTGDRGAQNWALLDKEFRACGVGLHQSPIDISATTKTNLPPLQLDWRKETLAIEQKGLTTLVIPSGESSMLLGDDKYELIQFHIHGPSEHTVAGRQFALEIHFVHRHPVSKAISVIGVLIAEGGANQTFSTLIKAITDRNKTKTASLEGIDISALLPKELGYWSYDGSLTTPPCSEIVAWHVLKGPLMVSEADIKRFIDMFSNSARPVQNSANRIVLESN